MPTQRAGPGGHREHHIEDCSATLLAPPESSRGNTLVTAWHCLEHYGDLSKPIIFILASHAVEAYRVADGGGMHADWALLRLSESLPLAQPMALAGARASAQRSIIMAGFSRDTGAGHAGTRLSYDPDCKITLQRSTTTDTDCHAFKGASGGAVVQLSGEGLPLYSGVVSEGDSDGFSRYVPVERFRLPLSRALARKHRR